MLKVFEILCNGILIINVIFIFDGGWYCCVVESEIVVINVIFVLIV